MKVHRASALAVTVIALLATPTTLHTQWLHLPTPGIPRTADGKPNLSAPVPRTSDGKPDLSGLWRGGRLESDLKPSDAQPWAAEGRDRIEASVAYNSWSVRCLPPGPMINFKAGLFRIIPAPGVTAMLYEMSNNYRQIFTDGRRLPDDPNPTWQGYSVGRWEGETFVVETVGFNDRSDVGRPAYPYSEALRFTERYRRRDFGHIDLDMIVDDPKAFTRVWTMHAELVSAADDEILEFVCTENEKDRQRIAATPQTSGNAISVDLETLRKYAGTYEVTQNNGVVVSATVVLDGDHLTLTQGRQLPGPLVPQSTTMFLSRAGAAVEFIANERGEVNQLIIHIVEGDMKGGRTGPPR
jgi:hypothetical protein